jgi:putative spermidine/putrescine transport system ATP-binding protein
VALARALVGKPRLLLLDEPLSSLDADLRSAMRSELARLRRELAVTTLYVTHDREDAAVLADRVIEMSAGRIISVNETRRKEERA